MAIDSGTDDAIDIIDTHLHLWDLGRVHYPWLAPDVPPTQLMGDLAPIRRNYLAEDFLAEARPLRIVKAVHVEANPDPVDPVIETYWLQDQADSSGFPQAIVAAASLEDPRAEAVLEQHRQSPNLRGVRQSLNWPPAPGKYSEALPERMSDSKWRAGFKLLAPLGLSFDLQVDPTQMAMAAELARSFSETTILVDHVGMPRDHSTDGVSLWRDGMRMLATQPNVAIKISGFGMIDPNWTVDNMRPLVLEAIEIFGPGRVMFGSNFPVENLHRSLQTVVTAIKAMTVELNHDERVLFFHGNASRYYRLD
jgi:predicted TIM-barrel fold metal-dependent hydrolase